MCPNSCRMKLRHIHILRQNRQLRKFPQTEDRKTLTTTGCGKTMLNKSRHPSHDAASAAPPLEEQANILRYIAERPEMFRTHLEPFIRDPYSLAVTKPPIGHPLLDTCLLNSLPHGPDQSDPHPVSPATLTTLRVAVLRCSYRIMTDHQSRHVAYEQVKLMLDFMGQHVDFATGQLRSLEARHVSKHLWNELTQILNNCRGTRKTTDGWSKYWSDFKNKLKNKVRIINKRKRLGSTNEKGVRPLTKLEKRAVVILGPCFEKKVSRLAMQDFQDEAVIQKLPQVTAEVKIETVDGSPERTQTNHIELPPHRKNIAVTPHSGHIEILPDNHSDDDTTRSDFDEDSDNNAAEPLMSSLYPKWLIEIEQKRAEAELARAKAEESRASVAAQATQAAMIQAEALRTLAQAASTQADAMTKIASILDRIPQHGATNILGGP